MPFNCVNCHSGQVESLENSWYRHQISEQAIGCEKCHGPGSLHVDERRREVAIRGDFDDTIVNPASLPRERQEAICGQCHLSADAEANVRGRTLADFRPSLDLADFRVRFQAGAKKDGMTVVGHVEQMRASKCYQQSPEMTCITCHSMHSGDGPKALAGRQSCLSCHETESCGLESAVRLKKSPDDNCVACHMPKSDTDIPHLAFHHHRIGVHDNEKSAVASTREGDSIEDAGEITAIDDLSHLSQIDKDRCKGLAYGKYSESGKDSSPERSVRKAIVLLESVVKQGLKDPEVYAALSRLYLNNQQFAEAVQYSHAALEVKQLAPETRKDALVALSRAYMGQKDAKRAKPLLEELCRLRYDAEDYMLLSICHFDAGDFASALTSARRAAAIEPDRPDLQEAVADFAEMAGDSQQSRWSQNRARQLYESLPPPR